MSLQSTIRKLVFVASTGLAIMLPEAVLAGDDDSTEGKFTMPSESAVTGHLKPGASKTSPPKTSGPLVTPGGSTSGGSSTQNGHSSKKKFDKNKYHRPTKSSSKSKSASKFKSKYSKNKTTPSSPSSPSGSQTLGPNAQSKSPTGSHHSKNPPTKPNTPSSDDT
jgi:hypothetical protein